MKHTPIATSWRASTRSGGRGECVEVAHLQDRLGLRDSKSTTAVLTSTQKDGWKQFRVTLQ